MVLLPHRPTTTNNNARFSVKKHLDVIWRIPNDYWPHAVYRLSLVLTNIGLGLGPTCTPEKLTKKPRTIDG